MTTKGAVRERDRGPGLRRSAPNQKRPRKFIPRRRRVGFFGQPDDEEDESFRLDDDEEEDATIPRWSALTANSSSP